MYADLKVFGMASAMAAHAGRRQAVIAQNMANADTPGYRARDLPPFSQSYAQAAAALRKTRPAHLSDKGNAAVTRASTATDRTTDPNGNTVSLELELMKSVEVKRQHDRAVAIYRAAMSILRTSLGRG